METIVLEAKNRDPQLSPKYLRKNRRIPAVYYGHDQKNALLELDYQSFRKVYMKAGSNQVVQLQMAGKKTPVLIHEVQFNPLTDGFDHVDFLHVNMNEEVTAMIPIEVNGVSPAVKDHGGILTTLKHEVEVTCLPGDLPHSIPVDISGLAELHTSIYLKDLIIPKNVKLNGDLEEPVLSVVPPKIEEEAPVAEAPAAEGAAPAAEGSEKESKE
jgi:large subunit ribosomal protein L25